MESCLYEGWVRHRRHTPVAHAFRYPLFMTYLDLSELDEVFRGRWLWSTSRPGAARFQRSDHFGDPRVPLDQSVRALVKRETGRSVSGPIRLLTHLRYAGYVFNPISLYYCLDRTGQRIEAVVADVTNTPWRERHQYVMTEPMATSSARVTRYVSRKQLHVSPFMALDIDYDWRFVDPGRRLTAHIVNRRAGETIFDATLALRRRPITTLALASVLTRYPMMTAGVVAGIYWQALRLRLKGTPFVPHPSHASQREGT